MERATQNEIEKVCREILSPLVNADGGEFYLVSISADEVHIHLAGTCSGCPGSTLTGQRVLEPPLVAIAPKTTVRVTTGWSVPSGARRL